MDASERDKIGEMLSAYLDGELSSDQSGEVERLIADDAEARALLVELREAADGVRQLPRAVAPSGILSEIQERVERQELLGPPDQRVTLSRHQRRPLRSILATAAALVITVGGGLWAISRLGGPGEQQHAARSIGDEESRIKRQLEGLSRPVRDRDLAAMETPGEANEKAKEYFAGRSDADRVPVVSEPKSTRRSAPAPATQSVPSDEKIGPLQALDGDESKLGMKQARDVKAGDVVVRGRFRSADLEDAAGENTVPSAAEEPLAKAGIGLSARMNERFEARSATLEQKLSKGVTVGALLDHPFANEPLRLEIEVAGADQAPKVAEQVVSLIRSGDGRHLGYGVRSEVRAELLDVRPGRVDDDTLALGADRPLMMEGEPQHNFQPAVKGETQYLARVNTETLERILDATRSRGEVIVGRRLAVGRMQAESDQDVERLAAMTLGEFDSRRAGRGGSFEPVDSDELDTLDLAALLRGIGVGPPKISEFGVGGDDLPDSEKPPPAARQPQFADASGKRDVRESSRSGGAVPGAPSEEGASNASRGRGASLRDAREGEEADESDALGRDEAAAPPSRESRTQSAPSRQPSAGSEVRGPGKAESESIETESKKAPAGKSEDVGQEIDALAARTEKPAMRNDLELEPATSPPLYTIVIRFVPVQSPVAQETGASEKSDTAQSKINRPPAESASPAPAASPNPNEVESADPSSSNPD